MKGLHVKDLHVLNSIATDRTKDRGSLKNYQAPMNGDKPRNIHMGSGNYNEP